MQVLDFIEYLPKNEEEHKGCRLFYRIPLIFVITSALVLSFWVCQSNADMQMFPVPGERYLHSLLTLSPRDAFAMVGCLLCIWETVLFFTLIWIRKKTR